MFFLKRKKGVMSPYVLASILAAFILALSLVAYLLLKETGFNFLDKIKDLFRMR